MCFRYSFLGLASFLLLLLFQSGYTQQLTFPGAEGFGQYAWGGGGGRVIEVTHLEDDGPGSFRRAVAIF